MTKTELIDAYADWFYRFKWNWFLTLKFRGKPSKAKAGGIFNQWITELEAADGSPEFRWVKVFELGAFGDHLHIHALVGGLRKARITPWLRRWREMGRDAQLKEFDPDRNGIFYMLKRLNPQQDFDIEIHMPPLDERLGSEEDQSE